MNYVVDYIKMEEFSAVYSYCVDKLIHKLMEDPDFQPDNPWFQKQDMYRIPELMVEFTKSLGRNCRIQKLHANTLTVDIRWRFVQNRMIILDNEYSVNLLNWVEFMQDTTFDECYDDAAYHVNCCPLDERYGTIALIFTNYFGNLEIHIVANDISEFITKIYTWVSLTAKDLDNLPSPRDLQIESGTIDMEGFLNSEYLLYVDDDENTEVTAISTTRRGVLESGCAGDITVVNIDLRARLRYGRHSLRSFTCWLRSHQSVH